MESKPKSGPELRSTWNWLISYESHIRHRQHRQSTRHRRKWLGIDAQRLPGILAEPLGALAPLNPLVNHHHPKQNIRHYWNIPHLKKKNTHFKIRHLDTMLIFSGHFHGISAGFPKKSNWYNCRIPATKTGCFSKRDTFLTTGFHINSDGRRYCPSARWKSIVSHVRSVQNHRKKQ